MSLNPGGSVLSKEGGSGVGGRSAHTQKFSLIQLSSARGLPGFAVLARNRGPVPTALAPAVQWPINRASLPGQDVTLVGPNKCMVNQGVALFGPEGGLSAPRPGVEMD